MRIFKHVSKHPLKHNTYVCYHNDQHMLTYVSEGLDNELQVTTCICSSEKQYNIVFNALTNKDHYKEMELNNVDYNLIRLLVL